MALPSRPNARLNGLPSGPRSRSQPRSASASREHSRTRSEPAEDIPISFPRQKSLTNLNEGRRGRWERDAPPVPALPVDIPSRTRDKLAKLKGDRRDSDDSTSSLSSGSSGRSGYSTPATAVESDEYEQEGKYEEHEEEKPVPRGFGYSLWGRLQSAATNLSINVSKSWESNGGLSSGEVTPPGQESRITQALKAYHIAKASRPSDLPEWLFDEKERGVASRLASEVARTATSDNSTRDQVTSTPTPSRAPVTNGRPEYKKSYADDEDRVTMSRAALRLKELRDAKAMPRKQTITFADSVHPRRAVAIETPEPPAAQVVSPTTVPPSVVRNGAGNTDGSGKRPVARGLPSGVRPVRRT
ncbi:hypothetical protein BC835DRAFT_1414595 [Cytidiella melzeri]|nr:hypothetical protein BC835DRAFT_1414595 [Cytidiella melzeri]